MARALSVGVALAGLAAAGALVLVARSDGDSAELRALGDVADGRVRETAAAVRSRVTTLAELPRLANGVATDEATMRDLTQEELAFKPKPGEAIEIAQRRRSGGLVPLLRIPGGGPAIAALAQDGVTLRVVGDRLFLSEVVAVQPKERADELTGVIAVSWPVDLQAVTAKLDALGRAGRLQTRDGAIALTARAPTEGIPTVTLPLPSDAMVQLVLEGGRPHTGLLALAAGLALLSLVAAALLWRRGAGAPATPAGVTAAASPTATGARTIGRYEIVRALGSGGMADVFLARATGEAGFQKLLALKVLNREQASSPVAVEHFLDEARLASQLAHPNVVQIADLGRAGNDYFIAMEFVDGADLERILDSCRNRGAQVPTAVALTVLRQICAGLHAAHEARDAEGKALHLVHRDVKSANVFIAKNGAVKVGDFGIARAREAVRKTQVGIVKGTAEYMAPEQRTGDDVDARADEYSVGAIAYEMLSGTFINLDLARLAHLGRSGWPHLQPLAELRPELPPELGAAVFRALSYLRDDRFPSCEAFEEELAAIAQRHGLFAGEKAVAEWVNRELALIKSAEPPSASQKAG